MSIYKVDYESFGEGECLIDLNDIHEFNGIQELVESDENLKNWIYEKLDNNENVSKESILDYYRFDEDVLTFIGEADSEEDFMTKYHSITTIDEVRNQFVETDVIYLFRNYQHSQNILLAKFEGFETVKDCKDYCIGKNLNYSEFQGNQYSLHEFNNCIFIKGSDIDKFEIEELEAIRTAENFDCHTNE